MSKRGIGVLAIVLIAAVVVIIGGVVVFSAKPQLAPAPSSWCNDTDGGVNYNVQGTACTSGGRSAFSISDQKQACFTDSCLNNVTLTERFCANGTVQSTNYKCPYGCSNGACLPAPAPYLLTVTKQGSGQGIVASNPAGINCGSDCSENYIPGTVVTLSASAASGSIFAGWSGTCSGTGSCVVTMDSNKNVTATFNSQNNTNTTMPDLDIISVSKFTGNQTNGTFYQITLTAVVRNIGNANAEASTTRFFTSPNGSQQLIPTPALAAGQQANVVATYFLSAGNNYTGTVNADWFNTIQESNENNNGAFLSFIVP